MTSTEFEHKLKEKDIICLLAEFLSDEVLHHNSLKYATETTRNNFIEKAEILIQKYEKAGIKLVAL